MGVIPLRVRKKPIEVEAFCFSMPTLGTVLAEWCGGRVRYAMDYPYTLFAIEIPTLEGTVTAQLGDWIIKGVQGEFYPCKPDIFALTYEAAEHVG